MSNGDVQATWPLEAGAGRDRDRGRTDAPAARPRRRRRAFLRALYAALALLALAASLLAFGLARYRGLTLGMIDHVRHATLGESLNLGLCIRYWLSFMERLEPDPATGRWGFPPPRIGEDGAVVAAGLDDCTLAYHRGDFETAVRCLDAEVAARGEREETLFWLGMSLLRRAENRNCLDHADHDAPAAENGAAGSYCALPLARHRRDHDTRRALDTFLALLERHDGEDRLYRWLASFAALALEDYPQAIPAAYRLPSAFVDRFYGTGLAAARARHPDLDFADRAAELGVATFDAGRGVAVEDFDGDGDLDLVTGGSFETLRYYRNRGGSAGFEDRSAEAGVLAVGQPFAITAADYDGDGRVDLFAARPFDHYVLLRNEGPGPSGDPRFRDVTEESGLLAAIPVGAVAATWISAWGDVDNDGDLDLFLAQWAFRMPGLAGLMGRARMDSVLLVNDGRGGFADGGARWGLRALLRDLYFIGAAFGDVDGDGDADLYLSSPLRRTSMLLRNDGDRFRRDDRVRRGESGFVAGFVDVDHDGRLDIFQSGFADARTSTEMAVFGEHLDRYRSGHSTVVRQTAAGGFEVRDDFFEGDMPMGTMGASWGDLDNDGCFDFYLGTGNPESWFVLPNQMLVGRRDGRNCTGALENVSMLGGFGSVQKGHGIVFFDFDDDGDQDVYSALGGMWPGDPWPNQLFVNEGEPARAWVKLRLRGRQTNRFGVGARIRVRAESAGGAVFERRYHMDNKTGFGSAPYLAHIGLLDAARIREVEVFWPASRCTARYRVPLRALSVLDEAACAGVSAAAGSRGENVSPYQTTTTTGEEGSRWSPT